MDTRRGRFRTKLCRNFALGHCPQGNRCNYIHASPEAIQANTVSPLLQPSRSQQSTEDHLSSTTFSPPLWPTLSPVTNASSDHFGYNWGPPTAGPETRKPPTSQIKYRPLSFRTTLCRHFLKNRGWCPVGEQCNYIHDLTLADFAKDDVRFAHRPAISSAKNGERGKAGSKHSHCWAYVQGLCHVPDCPYLHPVVVHMFAAHTPCLAWPNCRRGPLCPYKHPEPYISTSPEASPIHQTATIQPASSHLDTIPRGGMHYNGPPPPVIFTNPWEAWSTPFTQPPTMPYTPVAMNPSTWLTAGPADSGHALSPVFTQTAMPRPSFTFPPFNVAMNQPQPQPYTEPQPNYTYHSSEATAVPRSASLSAAMAPSLPEHEFPYVPPKDQRSGHARRVSVTIKSKEDLDALALDSSSSQGRLPWQTHADRIARRSWAPSSSSLRPAQATPPPALYGM